MRYQIRCTSCGAIGSTNRKGFKRRALLGPQECPECGLRTNIAEEIEDA